MKTIIGKSGFIYKEGETEIERLKNKLSTVFLAVETSKCKESVIRDAQNVLPDILMLLIDIEEYFKESNKHDRVGEKFTTNEGYEIEIVNYKNCENVDIKFKNNLMLFDREMSDIRKGKIKNPLHLSVYNVGYFGVGVYKATSHGKNTKVYQTWINMIKRCYDDKFHQTKPTYKDCSVAPEWHNFQVFAEWYEGNYKKDFELDKDILVKNNKIYSSNTCCFVPPEINTLITKANSKRGEYPIGVSYQKLNNTFRVYVSINNKNKYLGAFETSEEAFEIYRINKKDCIKQLANKYKDQITKACYKALLNYKININD